MKFALKNGAGTLGKLVLVERLRASFATAFQVEISRATFARADHRMGKRWEPTYGALLLTIRQPLSSRWCSPWWRQPPEHHNPDPSSRFFITWLSDEP